MQVNDEWVMIWQDTAAVRAGTFVRQEGRHVAGRDSIPASAEEKPYCYTN
jgi:hypothetical protein